MSMLKKVSLLSIILLGGIVVWFVSTQQQKSFVIRKEGSGLKIVVNTCQGITERAAAHLVAVVEFQRLEIAGRKARVFKICMQDRGYIENVKWLTYNTPIAESAAKEMDVSIGAALESLRRASMVVVADEEGRPSYWVLKEANP